MNLRELWALPLVEQLKHHTYRPWGDGRADQLAKENAAPDFPRIGRFYLLPRTDGRTVIVDPCRPWNDAAVSHHETTGEAELVAQRLALMHPADTERGDSKR